MKIIIIICSLVIFYINFSYAYSGETSSQYNYTINLNIYGKESEYYDPIENIFYKLYEYNNMKIHFLQSGGLFGKTREVTFDSDMLNSSEKVELNKYINNSNFFNTNSNVSGTRGADLYTYSITISNDEKKHTLSITEDAIKDENLQNLITFLDKKLPK